MRTPALVATTTRWKGGRVHEQVSSDDHHMSLAGGEYAQGVAPTMWPIP